MFNLFYTLFKYKEKAQKRRTWVLSGKGRCKSLPRKALSLDFPLFCRHVLLKPLL